MAQASIKLSNGKSVYVQAKGLKLTTRGKVQDVREVLEPMSKGDRRRVRKQLHALGRLDLVRATL